MKHNVRYSLYSQALTLATLLITIAGTTLGLAHGEPAMTVVCGSVLLILLAGALCYAPLSVTATGSDLSVRRPLLTRRIAYTEITSIRLWQPTMGERRLCGSGGFMGHWGWKSESDLGRYFAYYGRSSDCFLVTLRSGRRYVIGCEDAAGLVAHVRQHLSEVSA